MYICISRSLPLRLVFLCDIGFEAIPRGTIFSHPYGISINPKTKIGKNCNIKQGVTIGSRARPKRLDEAPAIIGDNVFIGCNASVLGPVTIGDNAIIGAHALVLADVPAYTVVKGVWK